MEAALARAAKAGLLSTKAYRTGLGRFGEDLEETIVIQPMSGSVLLDAAELSRKYALRAGDAIHIGNDAATLADRVGASCPGHERH